MRKKIQKKLIGVAVDVKRSKTGLGLFAREFIKRGDFVIEYFGKKISNKEAEFHPGRYLFEINRKWTIDGTTRQNKARYINHSCKPNCEVDIKKGKILIFALKNIRVGEEINYDYGDEYFTDFIKKPGCACGHHKRKIHEYAGD